MRLSIVYTLRKSAVPLALSSLAVALIVALAYRFQLNTAVVVLLCVSVIVMHALAYGFVSSAIVSIIAGLSLTYFFVPPIFSFRIADAREVVDFFVFLIVSNALAWLASKAYGTLRETQRRLAVVESAAHVAVWDRNLKTNVITFSSGYNKLYALAAGQRALKYDDWLRLIHPEDLEQVRAHMQDALTRTHLWDEEFRVVWPDGSVRWLLGRGTVFTDETGQTVRIGGVNVDITSRKHMDEALRQSERRFRLAIQATNDAIWDLDLVTGTVSWNETYSTLYGRPPETSKSWQWWIDRIHPDDRERTSGGLRSALSGNQSTWTCEYRFRRIDGAWAYIYDRAYIARDPSGTAWRVIGAMEDLTERKRVEAELRESEERFRGVFEEGPLGLGLVGKNYRFEKVNGALCRMVGYSEVELLQKSFVDITHPDDAPASLELAERLFKREEPIHKVRMRYVKKSGEIIWVDMTGSAIRDKDGEIMYGLAMIEDITEVKRTQEEAVAVQKLESLGVLAGGIAHDFNNLLGGILASAEVASTEHADGLAVEEELRRIKTASIRGAEIVRELMIYGGEERTAFEPVDLAALVNEMLNLLKVSISKRTVLKIEIGEDLSFIYANPAQIRQVIMNLVTNASEAIGDEPGTIRATIDNVKIGPGSRGSGGASLPEGDYVRLEVSDTGTGMTPEVQVKIFDPFFTTKQTGHGLGLAAVLGIIHSHGGTINVESASGQGSRFQILLPRIDPAVPVTKDISVDPLTREAENVTGTVLVVEDEQILRVAVSKKLRIEGFSVIEADDGTAGASLFRENETKIDVVLLDVTLPGSSSREVLQELRRIRPGVKVILTSAFNQDKALVSIGGQHVWGYVRKPYRLNELTNLVRNACLEQPKMRNAVVAPSSAESGN
jgi:two-component system, cell cycle sensor histidine kinase and response regulator CckA